MTTKEPTLTLKRIIWERNNARAETLSEVEKIIDSRIDTNKKCMKQDTYKEQIEEHTVVIEELELVKSKLKQLEGKSLVEKGK